MTDYRYELVRYRTDAEPRVLRKGTVSVPDLVHYGYDGSNGYTRAWRAQNRQVMRRAKAACGLTGVRGVTEDNGSFLAFMPRGAGSAGVVLEVRPI